MMKLIWIVLGILIVISAYMFLKDSGEIHSVCAKDQCFIVELAQTPVERMKGLMFRESLEENAGMLFIFPEPGTYGFWMKNTSIPLDIIWLDETGRVVQYVTAYPCTASCQVYSSSKPASYVLELNAGTLEKHSISSGERFTIFINSQAK